MTRKLGYILMVSAFSLASCHKAEHSNPFDPWDFPEIQLVRLDFESRTASARLSWERFEGGRFEAYKVQRKVGRKEFETIATLADVDTTCFRDTGLEGNTDYTYRVLLYNIVGLEHVTEGLSGGFHMFAGQWGNLGSGEGQFDTPLAIDLGLDGAIYVLDAGNSRVQKFDSEGNFLLGWGTAGTGDGQFDRPLDLAVDSEGNVYVTDCAQDRIQKFDAEGRFLWKYDREDGWGTKAEIQLVGIAVDGNDDLLVIQNGQFSPHDHRLYRFSLEGWIKESFSLQEMMDPIALVLWNGRIVVADRPTGWLYTLEENGSVSPLLHLLDSHVLCDLSLSDDGRFFVVDGTNHRIAVLLPERSEGLDDSGLVTSWGGLGAAEGAFNFSQRPGHYEGGIVLDNEGNIYVADTFNHRVQKFGP